MGRGKKNKTKERYDSRHISLLVRLKGFEPPTFWFVAKHSIQLSYSRICNFEPVSLTA